MKVLLFGYYGDDNLGDEALLQGIINSFKLKNENVEVTVLSKNPVETQRRYGVRSIIAPRQNKYFKEYFKEMRNTDIFVLGGGGLVQDFIGIKQLIYWIHSIVLAKMLGKKGMLYCVGAGPLKSKASQHLTKFCLNFADLVTVRDIETYNLLKSVGVKEEKLVVTGDPAFLVNEFDSLNNIQKLETETIGISFLPYYNIVNKPSAEGELEKVFVEFIDYITSNYKYNVCLVPLHYMEGDNYDIAASKRILQKVKNKDRIRLMDKPLTPTEAVGLFSQFKLMVGMRLHSLILSSTASTPFIGINYHPKVESFISLVEQASYSVAVESLDIDTLKELFEKLISNIDTQVETIDKNVKKLRQSSLQTQDYFSELLEK